VLIPQSDHQSSTEAFIPPFNTTSISPGNSLNIPIARPSILLPTNWLHIHRLLWLLHKLHQTSWHVVGPCDSIVLLTIFAEAQENRIDCHLVDGEKTVANEKSENAANNHRNWGIVKAGFVLEWVVMQLYVGKTWIENYLNQVDAYQNCRKHNENLSQQQHKIANGIYGKNAQRIGGENVESPLAGDAERRAVHWDYDVSVSTEVLQKVFEASQATLASA
jgi:hypothetical protein